MNIIDRVCSHSILFSKNWYLLSLFCISAIVVHWINRAIFYFGHIFYLCNRNYRGCFCAKINATYLHCFATASNRIEWSAFARLVCVFTACMCACHCASVRASSSSKSNHCVIDSISFSDSMTSKNNIKNAASPTQQQQPKMLVGGKDVDNKLDITSGDSNPDDNEGQSLQLIWQLNHFRLFSLQISRMIDYFCTGQWTYFLVFIISNAENDSVNAIAWFSPLLHYRVLIMQDVCIFTIVYWIKKTVFM